MLKVDFWNIIFTIVNVIVLYMVLKHLLLRPVNAIIQERKEVLTKQKEQAERSMKQADDLKQEYQNKLEMLAEDAAKEKLQILNEAYQERDRILKQAKDNSEQIRKDSLMRLKRDQEIAKKELKADIATLAMIAATKIIKAGEGIDESSGR